MVNTEYFWQFKLFNIPVCIILNFKCWVWAIIKSLTLWCTEKYWFSYFMIFGNQRNNQIAYKKKRFNRKSWPSVWHACFVPGVSSVFISVLKQAVLSEVFMVFFSLFRQLPNLKLDHYGFLPFFQFIFRSLVTLAYNLIYWKLH